MMKKVEIIPIAKKKLQRRGIPEKWIDEALSSPDQVVSGYGDRKVAHKKHFISGKEYLLRVVYEDREHSDVVLTGYLTSQIERYWKEDEK